MSEPSQATPRIIVVGEDEVHDLLRDSGASWDTQHRVRGVDQMWEDLSSDRLDPTSVAVVFTDTVDAAPGELETAIAAMAPAAATFLVSFRAGHTADLLARVRQAALAQGADPDAAVHVLDAGSSHGLLDRVREVMVAAGVPVDFPATWPVEPGPVRTSGQEVAAVAAMAPPGPVAPAAPVAPEAPTAPVAPVAPVGPVAMTAPIGPVAPGAATAPVALLAPMAPVGPVGPVAPAAPAAPTAPVALLAPMAPVGPVAPAEPVAPVAPVAPAAPVTGSLSASTVAPVRAGRSEERHLAAVDRTVVTPAPRVEGRGPTARKDEGTGEVPSMPARQVPPTPGAKIPGQVTIAVTSSKGGSGKSTTAMMLAAQIAHSSRKAYEAGLAERPLRVVLLDMDTRDGQVASLIGRYVPTALNIRVQPRWDEATILDNLVHDPRLGIDCLLAPVRPRTADDVGPEFYRHVIRMLKTTHDVVVLDTSVNYLDPLISTVCLPEATAILFVTTLATTSVQGMARALREITEPVEHGGMGINRRRIGVVVNQSITEVGMDRDQVLQAALRVPIVGAIPLATKDVLTCTNFTRMHQLLEHPLLGPAYFKLARTCMPNAVLEPVCGAAAAPAPASPAPASPAHTAPPGVAATPPAGAPVLVGVGASGPDRPAEPARERRRGLFGRRG